MTPGNRVLARLRHYGVVDTGLSRGHTLAEDLIALLKEYASVCDLVGELAKLIGVKDDQEDGDAVASGADTQSRDDRGPYGDH